MPEYRQTSPKTERSLTFLVMFIPIVVVFALFELRHQTLRQFRGADNYAPTPVIDVEWSDFESPISPSSNEE